MSEIKLLPCPFCGGEAMHFGGAGQHCIRCKNCFNTNEKLVSGNTYTAFATSEEAANDWNTRKPMERIIERICNVRNNTPSTDFKNGCNASLHQIHREIDIKVKEEGGIE